MKSKLRRSGYTALQKADCSVHSGRIVLFGVVPSFYLKQVAQTVAMTVDGVRVENRLRVDPGQRGND